MDGANRAGPLHRDGKLLSLTAHACARFRIHTREFVNSKSMKRIVSHANTKKCLRSLELAWEPHFKFSSGLVFEVIFVADPLQRKEPVLLKHNALLTGHLTLQPEKNNIKPDMPLLSDPAVCKAARLFFNLSRKISFESDRTVDSSYGLIFRTINNDPTQGCIKLARCLTKKQCKLLPSTIYAGNFVGFAMSMSYRYGLRQSNTKDVVVVPTCVGDMQSMFCLLLQQTRYSGSCASSSIDSKHAVAKERFVRSRWYQNRVTLDSKNRVTLEILCWVYDTIDNSDASLISLQRNRISADGNESQGRRKPGVEGAIASQILPDQSTLS